VLYRRFISANLTNDKKTAPVYEYFLKIFLDNFRVRVP